LSSTVIHSQPPQLRSVSTYPALAEPDSLTAMLEGSSAMLTCINRERQRLRQLVTQGTATPHQILPLLARLEALAVHSRHIVRQLQWLCQDTQREGLTPVQPEHHLAL
jgi:hypothetical protein